MRQRRLIAVAGVAGVALVVGVAVGAGEGDGEDSRPDADRPAELPGGGRRLFPDRRVVAFYGAPQDEGLGTLGIGTPAAAAKRLAKQARPYATRERPVLPAFELLAVVAAAAPGDDGVYRMRQGDDVIRRYLRAARRSNSMLLLDIQPGRADFLTEAKALERWLREPDVGLALDPEWRMDAGEVPGETIGEVDATEVNAVSIWLSGIVRDDDLPEKLLLVHRFTEGMIERPEILERPANVAVTLNVDGFGTKAQKLSKYRALVPRGYHAGFKLFYREDTGLMSPREVNAVRPQPDVVVYE
ncbi:MAG TPA: hypothetical protein VFD31_07110 [Thermoleophilaceae bacterium]|nr:hypothetical protein [Thermoleophilaceae bacterium]